MNYFNIIIAKLKAIAYWLNFIITDSIYTGPRAILIKNNSNYYSFTNYSNCNLINYEFLKDKGSCLRGA